MAYIMASDILLAINDNENRATALQAIIKMVGANLVQDCDAGNRRVEKDERKTAEMI